MAILTWVTFLLCIYNIFGIGISEKNTIIPLSTYPCDDIEASIRYSVDLVTIDENGRKAVDIDFELEDQFTEMWKVHIKIDQWISGAWDEDIFSKEGRFCDLAEQFTMKAWQRLRKEMIPSVDEKCVVEPGNYKLNKFEVDQGEYDFFVAISGKFRTTTKIFDDADFLVACLISEFETNALSH